MKGKLQTALDWLRGFLEGMMGAQAYDEATFRRQVRDLLIEGTPPVTASGSVGTGSPSDPSGKRGKEDV